MKRTTEVMHSGNSQAVSVNHKDNGISEKTSVLLLLLHEKCCGNKLLLLPFTFCRYSSVTISIISTKFSGVFTWSLIIRLSHEVQPRFQWQLKWQLGDSYVKPTQGEQAQELHSESEGFQFKPCCVLRAKENSTSLRGSADPPVEFATKNE